LGVGVLGGYLGAQEVKLMFIAGTIHTIIVVLGSCVFFYYGNRVSPRGSDKPLDMIDRFTITFGLWALGFWLLTTVINFEALGFVK
jgi:hypothetical protein